MTLTQSVPTTAGDAEESHDSPTLWRRVAAIIADEVSQLSPGSRLSSEAARCRQLGVSRVTVRQALAHLQTMGLIESQPGSGWFRSDSARSRRREALTPLSPPAHTILGFSDLAHAEGKSVDSVVLDQRVCDATARQRVALRLAPGSRVLLLSRVRRLEGEAIAISRSIVPVALIPWIASMDFHHASLHACFRAAGHTPTAAETELQAVAASRSDARLLQIAEGAPLMRVSKILRDRDGRVIEQNLALFRGERYRHRSRIDSVRIAPVIAPTC